MSQQGEVKVIVAYRGEDGDAEIFELSGPMKVTVLNDESLEIAFKEAMKVHALLVQAAENYKAAAELLYGTQGGI
jgi:hypothetical protein